MTDRNENVDMSTGVSTVVDDHGDGTGVRTVYAPDGSVLSTEALTGLPIPEPPQADPLVEVLAAATTVQAAADRLAAGGTSVDSIAEVRGVLAPALSALASALAAVVPTEG